jgi:hypothetical protein
MTIAPHCDPAVLQRLRALIAEALALADEQRLHATGIALDTARLSVEDALAGGSSAVLGPIGSIRNGAASPGRG